MQILDVEQNENVEVKGRVRIIDTRRNKNQKESGRKVGSRAGEKRFALARFTLSLLGASAGGGGKTKRGRREGNLLGALCVWEGGRWPR